MRCLLLCVWLGFGGNPLSQQESVLQQTLVRPVAKYERVLFELGTSLTLLGQYEEAEVCYRELANMDFRHAKLPLNRGNNFLLWGFSLFDPAEALELIGFVPPIQFDPGWQGSLDSHGDYAIGLNRGSRMEVFEKIVSLQNRAITQYKKALTMRDPPLASVYLNWASAEAILSRLVKEGDTYIADAFAHIQQAERYAPRDRPVNGYIAIVKGIMYGYDQNETRQRELFRDARDFDLKPDDQILALLSIKESEAPEYYVDAGDKFSNHASIESIDGILLREIKKEDFRPNEQIFQVKADHVHLAGTEEASLWYKTHPQSWIFLYHQSFYDYILIQRTAPGYLGYSSRGVKIGDSKGSVLEKYGPSYREQGAIGGRYLYYRRDRILFFLNARNQVDHWLIWETG